MLCVCSMLREGPISRGTDFELSKTKDWILALPCNKSLTTEKKIFRNQCQHLLKTGIKVRHPPVLKELMGETRQVDHQKDNSSGRKMCSVLWSWRDFRSHEKRGNITGDVSIEKGPECRMGASGRSQWLEGQCTCLGVWIVLSWRVKQMFKWAFRFSNCYLYVFNYVHVEQGESMSAGACRDQMASEWLWATRCECWELNLDLLQEKFTLLTTAPSLKP